MGWTVGEVARLAGVTVRTLHHYDDIGLLAPSGRSDAGYRLYDRRDLERLQRILAYRGFDVRLDKIAALLDDPNIDPIDYLRRQHKLLCDRREELTRMITALEKTMEAHKLGIQLEPEELFEVFGKHDPSPYADEVEEHWGDTDAYRESQHRASSYSKTEWQRMKTEVDDHNRRLVEALQAGHAPDSSHAMDLAEEHREHICRWFYDCPTALHRELGEMYVADSRFTKTYEDLAPGLAQWVRDAWVANSLRQEG
ncbi:MAG: MerR family transcriptional regulator [Actinobacteria bacterium]|nr:MerR family transcriptional regulator [Actinomycetota bacterium]